MAYRSPLTPEELAKLKEKIKPLPEAFDLISDHIVITDINANIIYANKGVERETGYPIAEIISKNPGDLWGGHMTPAFYEDMWSQLKKHKRPFVGEVRNVRKDGSPVWQELRIFPVFGSKGEIEIFIGIEPDITQRKLIEEKTKRKFVEMDALLRIMEGRELKMMELKNELKTLRAKL